MANETRIAFSPLNHKINLGGITVTGFASGTYLEIKPNTNISDYVSGADGEIHTNLIANNTATATLNIYPDNPTYKLLRAAAVAFQTIGTFVPFTSVNILDPLDTTFSANSNISLHSTDKYSQNATDMVRTYEILLHNAIRV
jgi:hypothetical protein